MPKPKMIQLKAADFEFDMLRALQCAYYCHAKSIVPDHEYDQMEKDYDGKLPVGSDRLESYSPAQRALCMYFLFSGYFVGPGNVCSSNHPLL